MHKPAGVVEILVQILPEYPYSEFQNTPPLQKWKLSESPNPRVSEYPPNENCQRVQIREFQNTPQMKIVRESKSESFRIPPPNENCQRVQIREFQNTPHQPKMKIVRESKSESFRNSPPPKLEKLQISNFRIVLQPGRSYVETNL